jgi:NhaP-type Na+/H+ or K+/H+ antiporter
MGAMSAHCEPSGVSVAVRLPRGYCRYHLKGLGVLLGPAMLGCRVVCATTVHLLFGTSCLVALITSACLTPTDPVLAASILEVPNIARENVRRLLVAESAVNDRASFPFLYSRALNFEARKRRWSRTRIADRYDCVSMLC